MCRAKSVRVNSIYRINNICILLNGKQHVPVNSCWLPPKSRPWVETDKWLLCNYSFRHIFHRNKFTFQVLTAIVYFHVYILLSTAIDSTLGLFKVTIVSVIKQEKKKNMAHISAQDKEILTPGFGIIRMLLLQG